MAEVVNVNQLLDGHIADSEIDVASERARSLSGEVEHRRADVDARQANATRVVVEVPSRSDADLENLSRRLRTHPLAAPGEQQPLEKLDVLVVPEREFLPNAAALAE